MEDQDGVMPLCGSAFSISPLYFLHYWGGTQGLSHGVTPPAASPSCFTLSNGLGQEQASRSQGAWGSSLPFIILHGFPTMFLSFSCFYQLEKLVCIKMLWASFSSSIKWDCCIIWPNYHNSLTIIIWLSGNYSINDKHQYKTSHSIHSRAFGKTLSVCCLCIHLPFALFMPLKLLPLISDMFPPTYAPLPNLRMLFSFPLFYSFI